MKLDVTYYIIRESISLNKFRKITAQDQLYQHYSNKFEPELKRYENYLRSKTNSKSGMPASYRGYLIRFLVHIKEIFNEDVARIENMQTVELIEKITKLPDFTEFNRATNNYYSATFAAFRKYVHTLNEHGH